jgi:Ca2+-binding RTX toxin-like protein
MPVFALYNFNENGAVIDSATANGAQDGSYINGATAMGGDLILDGVNDFAKIAPSTVFQMDRGTLEINFTTGPFQGREQTVLSRDSVGQTEGGYRIEVLPDGAVRVVHETAGGQIEFTTGAGFVAEGETVNLTYSWDQGGTGGTLVVNNTTDGATFTAPVPNSVTMDMGAMNGGTGQDWFVGAGQQLSNPGVFNDVNEHFTGTVEFFSLSDTVDNTPSGGPTANPDTAVTDEDTPVTIDVLTNDSDPTSQPLTVTTATSTNGTVTIRPDGRLDYTPNGNYNGPDTITYTVRDPDGNTATSTVTVTVRPVNDAPEANDDSATTTTGTSITVPVLDNDTDVDGNPLTVTSVTGSPDGTPVINGDGSITFTPAPGFTGTTSFTYTVSDGNGGTDTGIVRITVTGPARDGIVRGTAGGDLIDTAYIDPFDADRIEANDAIIPGDGPNDDRVEAGAGNDTIRSLSGNDTIRADEGDDSVEAGEGNDEVSGNAGNDTILGGAGRDEIFGQQDDDFIDAGAPGVVLPDQDYPGLYPADTDPLNDLDTVYGGLGNDTILGGDDADALFGDDGRDSIDGGFDNDTIDGGQGADTILGGEGADRIDAGMGDDLVYGGLGPTAPDAVNIRDDQGDLRPGNGNDEIFGGTGRDTIFGLDDDDTIFGGDDADLIDGGIDEDSLFGGAGNDTITGGQGADTMLGGADRDTFRITTPSDGFNDVINGNEEGDDFDVIDLSGLTGPGRFRVFRDADNVENGRIEYYDTTGALTGTTTFTNIEAVVCFTPGTLIATPKGEVPVEELRVGDKIITRDNGIQEIRWAGAKAMTWNDFRLSPHLRPILIRKGSLGNGLPEQDMMVSPNHRMLVANDRTALYFDEHEVLVAAKHLIGGEGVTQVESVGTTYLHFLCDRHEVVLANGAWSESFQPGDYTLKSLGNAQRNEIFELFPELKTTEGLDGYAAARRTLKRHEARLLVR